MLIPPRRNVTRSKRSRQWMVTTLAAAFVLSAWAFASPPGAAPDDNFHLASIWCGHGLDSDQCRSGSTDAVRTLPPELAAQCYIRDATVSAGCMEPELESKLAPDGELAFGNWLGMYPPVYYAAMSYLTGDDLGASVLRMRLASAFIALGLVVALCGLLSPRLSRVAARAYLITCVPLGLFVYASNNPSGWATVGVGAAWLALYGSYETTGRRRWGLWGVSLVGTVMAAGSRADASAMICCGVVATLILRSSYLRQQWRTTCVALANCVIAVLFLVSTAHVGVLGRGFGDEFVPSDMHPLLLALTNAAETPALWMGMFGVGGLGALGWFDTPMPAVVGFVCFGLLIATLASGLAVTSWRKLAAAGLVAFALIGYPVYLLTISRTVVGNGVQPRYLLPLAVVLVGVCLLPGGRATTEWRRGQAAAGALALSLAHSAALFINVWRYTWGIHASAARVFSGAEWWWNVPFPPWAVWLVGSVAFFFVSLRVLSPPIEPDSPAARELATGTLHSARRARMTTRSRKDCESLPTMTV